MTAACDFISLGEKLLDEKKEKRKEKEIGKLLIT